MEKLSRLPVELWLRILRLLDSRTRYYFIKALPEAEREAWWRVELAVSIEEERQARRLEQWAVDEELDMVKPVTATSGSRSALTGFFGFLARAGFKVTSWNPRFTLDPDYTLGSRLEVATIGRGERRVLKSNVWFKYRVYVIVQIPVVVVMKESCGGKLREAVKELSSRKRRRLNGD